MNRVLMIGKHVSRYSTALHTHQNHKLIYCNAGGGQIRFEDGAHFYAQGDLVIIEPHTLHINIPDDDFIGTYLTLDQVPFKFEQVLLVHDTDSHAIAQCMYQLHEFHQLDFFNKDSVVHSYATLLCNLIAALASRKKISPVIELLKDAMMKQFPDPAFDINALFEAQTDYNTNYLKKRFRKEVGTSPQQFLISIRLSHATKLLAQSTPDDKLSISQIAYACGYDDPLYFSRAFKSHYGSSPKAFYLEMHC
ncbi:MAG: AraC family transcriptional regulator [Faecalibacterium sp.]